MAISRRGKKREFVVEVVHLGQALAIFTEALLIVCAPKLRTIADSTQAGISQMITLRF